MSQQLAPHVDWMALRVGAAMAAPVPAGPPAEFTMAKPRALTGLQALLWVLAASAACADLATAAVMARDFQPLSLAALAYALYATVQAFVSPKQIGRGKRWAWVWSLVSALIGLVLALAATMVGRDLLGMAPIAVYFSAGVAVLYLVLAALLCSRPVREWVLMHRVRRGEVRVEGAPGPGAALMAEHVGAAPADGRPRSLAWAQTAFWAVALMPLAWSAMGTWALAVAAGLGALALTSSIGLFHGRFWARVFTLVWVGAVGVATGGAVVPGLLLATGTFGIGGVEMRAGIAVAAAFGLEFALACVAFGLLFGSGVRRWTAPAELVMAFRRQGADRGLVLTPAEERQRDLLHEDAAAAVEYAATAPAAAGTPPVPQAPVPQAPASPSAPAGPPRPSGPRTGPGAPPAGPPPAPRVPALPPHHVHGPQRVPPGAPAPHCAPPHHVHGPQRPPVPRQRPPQQQGR